MLFILYSDDKVVSTRLWILSVTGAGRLCTPKFVANHDGSSLGGHKIYMQLRMLLIVPDTLTKACRYHTTFNIDT